MSLYVGILFLILETYVIDIIVIQSYTWTVEMCIYYLGLTQCRRGQGSYSRILLGNLAPLLEKIRQFVGE